MNSCVRIAVAQNYHERIGGYIVAVLRCGCKRNPVARHRQQLNFHVELSSHARDIRTMHRDPSANCCKEKTVLRVYTSKIGSEREFCS